MILRNKILSNIQCYFTACHQRLLNRFSFSFPFNMTKLILITICSVILINLSLGIIITGPSQYKRLITEWSFAYDVASNIFIGYNSTNNVLNSSLSLDLITDIYTDFSEIPSNKFVFPMVNFQVAIIYNIPLLNSTLKLNKHLVQKMLVNSTWWNDEELVALNPGLSIVGGNARFILNRNPDQINQLLISYFLGEDTNGTWIPATGQLVSNSNLMTSGYDSVASTLSGFPNSIAFVPLPIVSSYVSATLNVATLVLDNGQEVHYNDPTELSFSNPSKNQLLVSDSLKAWPFQLFGYAIYDLDAVICDDILHTIRYFYWDFGNDQLYNQTIACGFASFNDSSSNTILRPFLRNATCLNTKLLTYTNLSVKTRSNAVFAITLIGVVICVIMVISTWVSRPEHERTNIKITIHYLIGLFGLSLSLTSFVVWWFPPSEDTYCIIRYWFSGLGYTNDIAFVFFAVYAVHVMSRKLESGNVTNILITPLHMALVYATLELLEIAILILWQVVEQPKSEEIVVSDIDWTSVYKCSATTNVIEIIQTVYFCLISIWGCYMVYRYWINRGPEDGRLILIALCNQILIFILVSIFTSILSLDDDQLYVITNPAFLFLILNIFFAFFMRRLFFKVQSVVLKSNYSIKSQGYDSYNSSDFSPVSARRTKSNDSSPSNTAPASPASSIPPSPDRNRKSAVDLPVIVIT